MDTKLEHVCHRKEKKMEEIKVKGALGKKGKRNIVEKPLRINIDD